jgi:serine/threonine protein kinase
MDDAQSRIIGRYAIHGEIAAGGMATVHFGRLLGPVGFSRPVAIKQLHPRYARDPEFTAMFLDEARIAARIQHPNVVSTLDVVSEHHDLFLVMEYVQGESLARLIRETRTRKETTPAKIASAIAVGILHGLHAAHEAKDTQGQLLQVVHRDVSPQNVLVGIDGVPRVLDFGVAKAVGRATTTGEGHLKGKLAYMAPEQLRGQVSSRTDVFAAAIVFWETLTGRRLFSADNEAELLEKVTKQPIIAPSTLVPELSESLDAVIMRGLERDPQKRFASAREMALAIEQAAPLATPTEVGAWVDSLAGDVIRERAARLAEIESDAGVTPPDRVVPRPATTDLPTLPLGPANEEGSLAGVTPKPAPASRRRVLPLAIALGVGVAIGALALSLGNRAPRPEPAPVTVSAPASPTVTATGSVAATTAIATATATATAPAPATASGKIQGTATVTGSGSGVKVKPKVTAKPVNTCDPPYERKNGKLVPKPGCL